MGTSTARFSSVFVARTVLAALLMCAVLSVSVPIASVSARALLGRGAPDCNGGVSGCANLNRQRNSASVTDSEHLPHPTNIGFRNLHEDLARARDALGRRYAPRGPPVLFS